MINLECLGKSDVLFCQHTGRHLSTFGFPKQEPDKSRWRPLCLRGRMVKEIALREGQITLVDDGDYEIASLFKWSATSTKRARTAYAIRRDRNNKMHLLHRDIMNAPDGVMVDHINGNGLDNRRCNLRFVDKYQNTSNRRPSKVNKLGFKGVRCFPNKTKAFRATITHHHQVTILGYFLTVEEAAKAYDSAAVVYFGDYARLNFPKDGAGA